MSQVEEKDGRRWRNEIKEEVMHTYLPRNLSTSKNNHADHDKKKPETCIDMDCMSV